MAHSHPSLRTPLAKVRGLGSAKDGTSHWWWQRITALLLIPLCLWFVYSLMTNVVGGDRAMVADWFASPLVSAAMLMMLTASFYHAKLGLQVVIEDYVHQHCMKLTLLIGNVILFSSATVISWIAVIKLHIIGL